MSEVKKCQKCGGEMDEAETLIPKVTIFPRKGHLLGDRTIPFYCKIVASLNSTRKGRKIKFYTEKKQFQLTSIT